MSQNNYLGNQNMNIPNLVNNIESNIDQFGNSNMNNYVPINDKLSYNPNVQIDNFQNNQPNQPNQSNQILSYCVSRDRLNDELKNLLPIMMAWSPDGWIAEEVIKETSNQMRFF